eukprot:45213-Chlamydomonas_euryale.AAC.1
MLLPARRALPPLDADMLLPARRALPPLGADMLLPARRALPPLDMQIPQPPDHRSVLGHEFSALSRTAPTPCEPSALLAVRPTLPSSRTWRHARARRHAPRAPHVLHPTPGVTLVFSASTTAGLPSAARCGIKWRLDSNSSYDRPCATTITTCLTSGLFCCRRCSMQSKADGRSKACSAVTGVTKNRRGGRSRTRRMAV